MSGSTGVSVSTNGSTITYTSSNDTSYAVTPNTGLFGFPTGSSTVVITYPSSSGLTPVTLDNVPNGNIISGSSFNLSIVSLIAGSQYVVLPGASANINIGVALLTIFPNTVYIGGTATISSTVSALSGLVVNVAGGNATVAPGSLANALSGMTVNLTDGGTFTNGNGLLSLLSGTTIKFGAGGGTFVANAGGALLDLSSLTINGFNSITSKIEFKGLSAKLNSYSIATNSSGGSQTITLFGPNGVQIGDVTISGNSFPTGTFSATTKGPLGVVDSNNNLTISGAEPPSSAPCFLGQTMIATPEGEKAVSEMAIGDMVLSKDGVAMPVRWIGRRVVSTLFADPLRSLPIRIQAGALGDGLPKRDLLISPDHALLLDGILANAGTLVNGETIIREEIKEESFTYYHIEVDDHALILAEGAPAETFIDHVERMAFDNWAEHMNIFGEICDKPEMEYPRAKSARQLPQSLKARLGAKQAA